jgi:hypothetical protein
MVDAETLKSRLASTRLDDARRELVAGRLARALGA